MLEEIKIALKAVNDSGESVDVSVVQDDEGRSVLRTVDAAPFGYDEDYDAIKQIPVKELPRFEFIPFPSQFGLNIEGNGEFIYAFDSEVMSKYNKFRIGIVSDSSHSFALHAQWRSDRSSLSSVIAVDSNLIDVTEQRGNCLISDFITDRLEIRIQNKDGEAHDYDVHVFGVRG